MRKPKKTEENYIYSYYQKIKDGSVTVGKWIRLLYEYLVSGLEKKDFFFDQKKAKRVGDQKADQGADRGQQHGQPERTQVLGTGDDRKVLQGQIPIRCRKSVSQDQE